MEDWYYLLKRSNVSDDVKGDGKGEICEEGNEEVEEEGDPVQEEKEDFCETDKNMNVNM